MQHFETYLADEAATLALGAALSRTLQPGMSVFLHGDLGAGKTTLTRALIHAAGYIGSVKSPTYTLAETYAVALGGQPVEIVHFDLYRMASPEEFLDAGFREYFNDSNICLVEWPEKGERVLPSPDLALFLDVAGAARRVELAAFSAKGSLCLSALHFAPNL